jgi:hypothetical protein
MTREESEPLPLEMMGEYDKYIQKKNSCGDGPLTIDWDGARVEKLPEYRCSGIMKKAIYDNHSSSHLKFFDRHLSNEIMDGVIKDSHRARRMNGNVRAEIARCSAMLMPFDKIFVREFKDLVSVEIQIGLNGVYNFSP